MTQAADALLQLQNVDAARDRLHERKEKLPLRADLVEAQARIADVRGAIKQVQDEADRLEREERVVEEEVRLIEEKIAEEERKLYSGEILNPKELTALEDEIGMLRRRKAPLEEKGLEELESRDQLLAERKRLEEELASLEGEAQQIQARIDAAVAEIEAEIAVEDGKRAELVPAVPSETYEHYEEIRASRKGVGVGALENGICSACREALSAVEVDRIKQRARGGDWLFRCEHCRRLLVVR